jgi:hypothetical protein
MNVFAEIFNPFGVESSLDYSPGLPPGAIHIRPLRGPKMPRHVLRGRKAHPHILQAQVV